MSETDVTGEIGGDAGARAPGVDRRQVALVALCLLGLVVAAFVALILPDAGGVGSGSGAGGGDGGAGRNGGGVETQEDGSGGSSDESG